MIRLHLMTRLLTALRQSTAGFMLFVGVENDV